MTTYTSPLDSQNQTYVSPGTLKGWQLLDEGEDQQLPFPDQPDNWQIVPPIVTEGRMAAMNAQNAALQEESRQSQEQETTTLFQVSFTGLDQQHYSVSATVKRPPIEVLAGSEHLTSSEPILRGSSTVVPGQPLLHPVRLETASPAESAREWSPLALPTGVCPSVAPGTTLGRPNVSISERVSRSPDEQASEEDAHKSFL